MMNLSCRLQSFKILTRRCSSLADSPRSIDMAFKHLVGEESRKPPLIIMHGFLGSKRNWNGLGLAYSKKSGLQRDVYLVDVRNHGDSPHTNVHDYPNIAEDIRQFLRLRNIDKASLLGHSMGGRAVMYFALKYPKYIDKLIVGDISPVSGTDDSITIPTLLEAMKSTVIPGDESVGNAKQKINAQLSEKIKDQALRMFVMTNLKENAQGKLQWQINIPTLTSSYQTIMRFPDITGLQCTLPTLFVYGEKSDFVKKEDIEKIYQIFPNAEFKCIADAGHWLHSDKPQEFLNLTTMFLKQ